MYMYVFVKFHHEYLINVPTKTEYKLLPNALRMINKRLYKHLEEDVV